MPFSPAPRDVCHSGWSPGMFLTSPGNGIYLLFHESHQSIRHASVNITNTMMLSGLVNHLVFLKTPTKTECIQWKKALHND